MKRTKQTCVAALSNSISRSKDVILNVTSNNIPWLVCNDFDSDQINKIEVTLKFMSRNVSDRSTKILSIGFQRSIKYAAPQQ